MLMSSTGISDCGHILLVDGRSYRYDEFVQLWIWMIEQISPDKYLSLGIEAHARGTIRRILDAHWLRYLNSRQHQDTSGL